ncbi:MAG: DUF167 domain-containing protein [Candidatus Doudnabacteria bacterium]|nr:DUF167 domain-containing protein [Candidatus Doudnabacteria bacterium]
MIQRIIVIAHPKSRMPRLEVRAGVVHIFVSESPVDGDATEAVRIRLAEYVGVPLRRVKLLRGVTGRVKVFVYE